MCAHACVFVYACVHACMRARVCGVCCVGGCGCVVCVVCVGAGVIQAFTPHNATIFYYFNLMSLGQFVPQLTLGNGLCNGTGAPGFTCTGCNPNPKTSTQWYMQAQYFWQGHDPIDSTAEGWQQVRLPAICFSCWVPYTPRGC